MPHTPHTPHTPQSTPHTPGGGNSGPPSVPPASQESTGNHNTSGSTNTTINNDNNTTADIPSDLNFDPAAVIDGEGTGQEALNVSTSTCCIIIRLNNEPESQSCFEFAERSDFKDTFYVSSFLLQLLPDNVVDAMEFLSYLDPPDLNTPPSSGASSGNPSSNDDILALFD